MIPNATETLKLDLSGADLELTRSATMTEAQAKLVAERYPALLKKIAKICVLLLITVFIGCIVYFSAIGSAPTGGEAAIIFLILLANMVMGVAFMGPAVWFQFFRSRKKRRLSTLTGPLSLTVSSKGTLVSVGSLARRRSYQVTEQQASLLVDGAKYTAYFNGTLLHYLDMVSPPASN